MISLLAEKLPSFLPRVFRLFNYLQSIYVFNLDVILTSLPPNTNFYFPTLFNTRNVLILVCRIYVFDSNVSLFLICYNNKVTYCNSNGGWYVALHLSVGRANGPFVRRKV